jgi:hypothetical protein
MNTPAPRLSFSKVNPKLQIAWDSVSSGVAKTCWRKYQLQIIEGWVSKRESLHLRYGQLYHRALEVYDHKRFEGKRHDEAMILCLRDLAEGCQDVVPKLCEDEGCPQAGTTHVCNGETKRVWWDPNEYLSEEQAKLNTKTIYNLFRTVVWYLEEFQHNPVKTVKLANGKPAVELSFRYELGYTFTTGEELVHSGHLDRLVEMGDDHYVMDRKTSKNTISGNSSWGFFAKFSPDNQMTGYTYAGKVALAKPIKGVIIDAAQIAKGFSRFERGFALRTEKQLEEWRTDFIWMAKMAEHWAEQDYWPMNDTACDNYGGCVFRDICSKDPQVRHVFLQSDFVKKPWDPLVVRGDI